MFYGQHVSDTRELFFTSWSKYQTKLLLTPLEQQLVNVILDHPEYHPIFNQQNFNRDHAYFPELGETNPFLHLGLHLAVKEQVSTNRPNGIADLFKQLAIKIQDAHEAEHLIMNCLAESLWKAQKYQQMPNENEYLQTCLRTLD